MNDSHLPPSSDPGDSQANPSFASPYSAYSAEYEYLEKTQRSGASWFYWIAALSVINTVIMLFDGSWAFSIGLAFTQVLDAVAHEIPKITVVLLFVELLVVLFFVAIGYFANQRMLWAFIFGTVIYIADALLCLLFQDWVSLAIHGYALYGIIRGCSALIAMNRMSNSGMITGA